MRIAILAYGSRGDIQPALIVGDELVRRGHSVALTVNRNLVDWARPSGLEIVPIPPDIESLFKSETGRRMLASGKMSDFSREIGRRERAENEAIARGCIECCRGADVVVSTVMTAYRGACIAEHGGQPHGLLLTIPAPPTSAWTHVLAPWRDLGLGWLNRATHELIFGMWWRHQRANIAAMCAMLGAPPPARRILPESFPGVHIYSAHLAPRPADWAPHHHIAGFVTLPAALRAKLGEATAPAGLDDWLSAGEPPVYFGFGSLPVLDPAALLADVVELTRARGMRALLCTGWTDYGALDALPGHVFACASLDHERYLPRCRAAVHHGGAGTTAAALGAGIPAVIVSVFADQPFWGWRLERAGVGAHLPYRKLARASLGRALDAVSDDATVARARSLGAALRAESGATVAADAIESWAVGSASVGRHHAAR